MTPHIHIESVESAWDGEATVSVRMPLSVFRQFRWTVRALAEWARALGFTVTEKVGA